MQTARSGRGSDPIQKPVFREENGFQATWSWALAAIVTLSVALRLAVIVPSFGRLDDPDNYLVLARSLASGRGLTLKDHPTAYRPPLYPMVLAPLTAVCGDRLSWGLAGLHLVLGAGSVVLTAVAAKRWALTPVCALIASAIVAGDPVLVSQGRLVMTETLATFLVAATLAALAEGGDRGALWGGLWFGLSALCRPSLLPAAGVTALAALAFGPGTMAVRLRRAALIVLATFATLLPWALRNARVIGEPVWTTTHGGYTLALANNPVYYAEVLDGPPGAVWSGPNQARWFVEMDRAAAGLTEAEADRRFGAIGLRMLAERPRDFARASLARLGRFWGIAPSGAVYGKGLRLATMVWTVPLWLALVLGLIRRALWSWPRVSGPAVILALSAVHTIFWTDMRMRAPIVPAIALVAVQLKGRAKGPDSNENGPGNVDRKKIQNHDGF
jgi:4-amino-4-deoxy-L-arabinose transferase-like glycosyltransferase